MATVLLTTDGSDLAGAAMVRALETLGTDHRFVALAVVADLHVAPAAVSPMLPAPLVAPGLDDDLDAEGRAAGQADLRSLVEVLGVETEERVEVGDAGEVICDVARELGADVVVVGSHGHGWLQRTLVGSTSTYVLRHAPCPVLVVRLEPAAEG